MTCEHSCHAGAAQLLNECARALEPAAGVLLDAVLAGAQDSWPAVSQPARAWLAAQAASTPAGPGN